MIEGEEKNFTLWKIGIIVHFFPGRDRVLRAVALRVRKSFFERLLQSLYTLELHCSRFKVIQNQKLNVEKIELDQKVRQPLLL